MSKIFPVVILFMLAITFAQCGKDDGEGGNTTPDITVSTSDFSTSIAENSSAGTVLGTIAGSTNSGSVTFTLKTESVAGAFSVNGTSGQLTIADASVYDFETNVSITGTVEVANGTVTQTSNITVTITDVDETPAPTVWSGAKITFTKAANSDPLMLENQDALTDLVKLTRLNDGGQLINIASETTVNQATSPAGTEWAAGTTADLDNLTFGSFRDLGKPKDVLEGNDFVLKLVEENIVVDVKFISWGQRKNGAFSYERSTQN